MSHVRLLGVQIGYGFSPEARVFATLLANRGERYIPRVLHQWSSQDRESAVQFERMAGIQVERIDVGYRYSPRGINRIPVQLAARARLLLSARRLSRLARASEIDVVYGSQQKWDSRIAERIALELQRPLLLHLHYNVGPWLGQTVLHRLKRASHIVTVSDFIRSQVLDFGVPPDRVTTVRNTMPIAAPVPAGTREAVRAELGLPESACVIGCVARLDRWKGQADAIAALAAISHDVRDLRLVLAGEGDILPELERQAAEAGVRDRVTFAGFRRDVPRVLAALDIFLHPALSDPCPLGVLEAAAAGLPVVGYEHGGMPELVAQGRTGLLVAPNDVRALARALETLASDPECARAFGVAARDRVATDFRPADAGTKFADVVRSVAVWNS